MPLFCAPKELFWLGFLILVTNLIFLAVMCFFAVIQHSNHKYEAFSNSANLIINKHPNKDCVIINDTAVIEVINIIAESILKNQITCRSGVLDIYRTIYSMLYYKYVSLNLTVYE